MRLSAERIKQLQILLKEHLGLEYTEEEAQQAGLAILRFVVAKQLQQAQTKDNEDYYRYGERAPRHNSQ